MEIYYKEWADTVMAAEKSQELWPKSLETKEANVSSSWRSQVRGNLHPSSFPSSREWTLSCSAFCSIQAFNGLDEACQQGGGQSSLLSLPVWVLTSSGRLRIHTAPTHSDVWSNIWALCGPVQLIHKVNYRNGCSLRCSLSDTYNLQLWMIRT